MHSLLMALVLLLVQAPQAPNIRPASLSGVVSGTGTNRPVTRAEVRLSSEDGGDDQTVISDGAGRFAFESVAPGRYRLSAARDGYVPGEFGQRRLNRPGQVVAVRGGQRRADLAISLTPTGVISGRVRDIYGEPVVNANVEALQFTYPNGRRTLSPVKTTTTNDLGEYRLFWMQPGEYVIRVGASANSPNVVFTNDGSTLVYRTGFVSLSQPVQSAPPQPPPPPPPPPVITSGTWSPIGNASGTLTAAPVYYPGTTDPSQALSVNLASGTEFPGIDMLFTEKPPVTITGRVVDPRTGVPASGVRVTLTSRSELQVQGSSQQQARVGNDGSFTFAAVLPGTYDLTASTGGTIRNVRIVQGPGGQQQLTTEENTDEPLFARMLVEVRGGATAIENLVLELQPGLELNGSVIPPEGAGLDVSRLRVSLTGDRTIFGVGLQPAEVGADGRFSISGLPPSDYQFTVQGLGEGMYVESARFGAVDALGAPFQVGAVGRSPLDIRIGTNPGTVDVATLDDTQDRLADMTVVLVPEPARRGRRDLYKVATSDANAVAQFRNVPPGDYKVFAWDDVPDGAWQNPDFLRRFENAGVPVRVSAAGREQAAVTVIR